MYIVSVAREEICGPSFRLKLYALLRKVELSAFIVIIYVK
jgi:hypothetical protein